ncbi:hypothetical protein OGAPHI_002836 [Ogataea philodendri]|uniref:VWFA domain-containing protein n=1 Tax=Ogataea philodendri TaxID=1378263 RepID=A0A9P8P8A8_9ASCO|nr:uncharacterized protein OGAPHI_002836 [Ogataea philodendri]KAH3667187.1 hypothetical protein OGAPHI_002836 [Ogataea philodendri]
MMSVESKIHYSKPQGPPPGSTVSSPIASRLASAQSSDTVVRRAELSTTNEDDIESKYQPLLTHSYKTINRIQSPKTFENYLRLIGKKKKSFFGGNKETKGVAKLFATKVITCFQDGLPFYAHDEAVLNQLIESNCLPRIQQVAQTFGVPGQEYSFYDLSQLCLFKIFFYIDNSGSMRTGNRLQQLHDFLKLFMKINVSTQPLRLKFMNNHQEIYQFLKYNHNVDCDCIETEQQLDLVLSNLVVGGVTPLATNLYELILKPEIRSRKLAQPLLIVTFTDGAPNGDRYKLDKVIKMAQKELKENNMPKRSICYQFAQIGTDLDAGEYLDSLDNDSNIGDVIDCTSPIEIEMKQIARKNKELSTEVNYVKKLLLGAIDISYDSLDEVNHRIY